MSDAALEAAQSAELAPARASWNGAPVDFVDQVDYQLTFRSQNDYMALDLAHINGVLERRADNIGIQGLGLYLDDDEAAEFERRQTLGDRIPLIVEQITGTSDRSVPEGAEPQYPSNFGGAWQDQTDGGVIVVAVTDAAAVDEDAIAAIAGGKENVRILDAHPSWDQVAKWQSQILERARSLGIEVSIDIDSTSRGRILAVYTADPSRVPESLFESIPATSYSLRAGGIGKAISNPRTAHSGADQQAGLYVLLTNTGVGTGTVGCTWGVSGNNNIDHYVVFAGHCPGLTTSAPFTNYDGWTNTLEMLQGESSSFDLTAGWRYLKTTFNAWTQDAGGFSTDFANRNCYHWSHCAKWIANRASHNSWETNSDVTCASLGSSNVWRCGYIRQENYAPGSGDCGGNGGWLRVEFAVIPGDSGAGAIAPYGGATTFDGIVSCQSGSSHAVLTTSMFVNLIAGLDANCWSVAASTPSPSAWPTCAIVDR